VDEFESLILLISSGLLLSFTGQVWVRSHAQTVAFMVLSVARFRHAVKSVLELIL